MQIKIFSLSLISLLVLAGCDNNTHSDPESVHINHSDKITIHLYQPDWPSVQIEYFTDPLNLNMQKQTMLDTSNGWWQIELEATKAQFQFKYNDETYNLGATQGCYEGSHYKCDTFDTPEQFRTSADEIWILDGVIYPYDPEQHKNIDKPLTILSLNLHTYQEFKTPSIKSESDLTPALIAKRVDEHSTLFDEIANKINELDPDIVCLQEVGEWHGKLQPGEDPLKIEFGATESNMVKQLLKRINKSYDYTMDWSHFGWDVWLEGSAILSKHPILDKSSRYITDESLGTKTFWKSRNIPKATIDLGDKGGLIDVYSIHTGWWDDNEAPFQAQFKKLIDWVNEANKSSSVLMCGDFNQVAGIPEQQFIINETGYVEQYQMANPDGLLDPTIGGKIDGWNGGGGKRIDLILLNESSPFKVIQAQRIFTQNVGGRVSDHTGVYAHFNLKSVEKQHFQTEYYLSGSLTGNQLFKGYKFTQTDEEGVLSLTTLLGAASDNPLKMLKPIELSIADNNGNIWSINLDTTTLSEEPVQFDLLPNQQGFNISADEPLIYQFNLDTKNKKLSIARFSIPNKAI